MSEPFLALFTHSEVFLSLFEGLVLRPLLFDFPQALIVGTSKGQLFGCAAGTRAGTGDLQSKHNAILHPITKRKGY